MTKIATECQNVALGLCGSPGLLALQIEEIYEGLLCGLVGVVSVSVQGYRNQFLDPLLHLRQTQS